MKRNSVLLFGVALIATVGVLSGCGSGVTPRTTTFRITLEDLTNSAPNSGQPFSPPVFITHDSSMKLWKMGGTASFGLQNIAESGNRTPMVSAIQPFVGTSILSMATPLTSPLLPGGTVTVIVTADPEHPYLSSAWMLGRTNDGFSGQDSVNLLQLRGKTTFNLYGLDAGTENNNEKNGLLGALGGGNGRDPENGLIKLHPGILGIADAPLAWNWNEGATPASQNPVARVTIEQIDTPSGS